MISSEVGTSLENTTLSTLDFDRRVISPKDVDTIIDGHGRKDAINARSLHLKVQYYLGTLNTRESSSGSE
ncbi:MAG: hypothetical protein ACTS7D_00700 [Candidatus Hodgkinia cicadicola]